MGVAEDVLLERSRSEVSLVIVAVFGAGPGSVGHTSMSSPPELIPPCTRSGISQVSTFPTILHSGVKNSPLACASCTPTNRVLGGRGSVMTTLAAVEDGSLLEKSSLEPEDNLPQLPAGGLPLRQNGVLSSLPFPHKQRH